MANRNQALIDEVNALEQKVAALHPEKGRDPFVSVAVGGLHTCRDNLTWHGQAEVAPTGPTEVGATKKK